MHQLPHPVQPKRFHLLAALALMDLFDRPAGQPPSNAQEEDPEGTIERIVSLGGGGEFTVARLACEGALARRRLPWLFVGWFWYVGMLVPVIGLVQVGLQAMADRYTYLPQIGLCIAATWSLVALWQACPSPPRTQPSIAAGLTPRFRDVDRGPDGVRLAAGVLLAGQRDDMDPRPGLHDRQCVCP